MKTFKDTNNKVHVIDEAFTHLLPSDCVEITRAEADAIFAPTPAQIKAEKKAKAQAKIEDFERKSIRAMREALLTNDTSFLVAIEADIVVERAKLND